MNTLCSASSETTELDGLHAGIDPRLGYVVCRQCSGLGSYTRKVQRVRHRRASAAQKRKGEPMKAILHVSSSRTATCEVCSGAGVVKNTAARSAVGCSRLRDRCEESQSTTHQISGRPLVAVVGGGISGAAVALSLQQRGVNAQVFERDVCFSQRSQVRCRIYHFCYTFQMVVSLLDWPGILAYIAGPR